MTKVVLKCPSCGHMIDFGPNWVPVDLSKPKTNADRIREMDNSKLAEWLTACLWGEARDVPFLLSCTVDKWLDWLNEEVEEGE